MTMGDSVRAMDVQELISYGDDLIKLLKDGKDKDILTQLVEGAKLIRSSCDSDFSILRTSLDDYQRKINLCKQEIEEAKSMADLEPLQKELEEELGMERVLREEMRTVSNEIDDLEQQRASIEERKKVLRKEAKDEVRLEKLLSMYASVTNIIPDLNDETQISGQKVERDKKRLERFEFDPSHTPSYEICNRLWKMMDYS